jgi:Eco29kI restriction endonuclease
VINKVVPFNPLDKKNLAASVTEAMLSQNAEALEQVVPFTGAGIYAIYYRGPFRAYEAVTLLNSDPNYPQMPVYVGKAVPAGARKGTSFSDVTSIKVLYARLAEHAESIRATKLSLGDFRCRYLVVDEVWIPLAESLLIASFAPLWNSLVDGFGNHDPGKGRYEGLRPRWDVLHPGRSWAAKCKPRPESTAEIEQDVMTYLRTYARADARFA